MSTRRRLGRILMAAFSVIMLAAGLTACSTGNDQAVHGGSFTFVSPGGKTEISYPVGKRGTIGSLRGPNLMTDKTIGVDDFSGKVVVLNFWGSWCPPCREEQDGLSLLSTQLAGDGVQFLGIDLKEHSQSAGQDFHREKDVPYPSIYDPTMRTILSLKNFPATAIPSTIVLDRAHRVAQIWLVSASVPMGKMKKRIAAIAAEKPASSAAKASQ